MPGIHRTEDTPVYMQIKAWPLTQSDDILRGASAINARLGMKDNKSIKLKSVIESEQKLFFYNGMYDAGLLSMAKELIIEPQYSGTFRTDHPFRVWFIVKNKYGIDIPEYFRELIISITETSKSFDLIHLNLINEDTTMLYIHLKPYATGDACVISGINLTKKNNVTIPLSTAQYNLENSTNPPNLIFGVSNISLSDVKSITVNTLAQYGEIGVDTLAFELLGFSTDNAKYLTSSPVEFDVVALGAEWTNPNNLDMSLAVTTSTAGITVQNVSGLTQAEITQAAADKARADSINTALKNGGFIGEEDAVFMAVGSSDMATQVMTAINTGGGFDALRALGLSPTVALRILSIVHINIDATKYETEKAYDRMENDFAKLTSFIQYIQSESNITVPPFTGYINTLRNTNGVNALVRAWSAETP